MNCPLCDSDHIHEVDYEAGVAVYECSDCGHKFNRFVGNTLR